MRPFDYQRAADVAGAVSRVAVRGDAAFLAGGTNLLDHMKLGLASPGLLVDITGLPLDAIEPLPDGEVRIGALVRNSGLAADQAIRQRYPVLSQAVLAGASGQLRNMATTGGNLLKRTRCPYFQDLTTPFNKREPGSGCPAVDGYHREHAILGTLAHCIAVHPVGHGSRPVRPGRRGAGPRAGRRAQHPSRGAVSPPPDEPWRDTVLEHGELVTAVDLPAPPAGARSQYRKVRDRAPYAFALVSVAVVAQIEAGTIAEVRIAFGGIAPKPWRARAAERVLRGGPATRDMAARAADAELAAARPLAGNAFKVPLARGALVAVTGELIGRPPHDRNAAHCCDRRAGGADRRAGEGDRVRPARL